MSTPGIVKLDGVRIGGENGGFILGIADQTPLVGAADERRQQTQEVFETLGRKILTILVAKLS